MTATEPDGAVPPRPPATGAPRDRRAAAAVALVVVGLLLWLGYRVTIGGEPHSFAAGATPPSTVELTAGKTYSIGLPGGRDQAARLLGESNDYHRVLIACAISLGLALLCVLPALRWQRRQAQTG